MLVQLLELYPFLCMELKRNVDDQLHLQMDWVNFQCSGVTERVQLSVNQVKAYKEYKLLDEFEGIKSSEGLFKSIKAMYSARRNGEANGPGKEYETIEKVAAKKFRARVEHKLLQGLEKPEMPLWLTVVAESTLEKHIEK
jgi:hypothetical protein